MTEDLKRRTTDQYPEHCQECLLQDKVHEKHHEFITVLIDKETQKLAFRQSVIEKTIGSLIWSFIVFVGVAIWKYITTAGGK